ncbi:MAG: hypothetical protein IJK91_01420 [Bacteroidales bacterium]|nr:hypothetical protein [Bacteroidales bacterium]
MKRKKVVCDTVYLEHCGSVYVSIKGDGPVSSNPPMAVSSNGFLESYVH